MATAQAYKLAQHDILTGLPNRSLLNQRLRQILAQAQRDGTHVACLFLDFDHFKRINDTLGHDAAVGLEPRVIIPMHYGEIGMKDALALFLKEEGSETPQTLDKLTIKRKDLETKSNELIVLQS